MYTLQDLEGLNTMPNDSRGWYQAEGGATLGTSGPEGGLILEDEEYSGEARISLERRDIGVPPFAITCGIYGWLLHTRFASSEVEARKDFEEMRTELARISDKLLKDPSRDETAQQHEAMKAMSDFVDCFPT